MALYANLPLKPQTQIRLLSFATPDADGPIELRLWAGQAIDDVSKNLHDFLQAVRKRPDCNKSRFWIDAICIDQTTSGPTGEKSQQVQIMAKIYMEARNVIVWLGQEDNDKRPVMKLMEPSMINQFDIKNASESKGFPTMDDWRSLARFFCRRYFKRAWAIQEIVCAKQEGLYALCASQRISWEHIRDASRHITRSAWGHMFQSPGSTEIEGGVLPHHGGPANLADIINGNMMDSEDLFTYSPIRSREYDCSSPKDKIYSLLGLRHLNDPALGFAINVDYDQEDCDIYTETAMQILDLREDLLLLYYAEGEEYRKIKNLPSWVPDWSVEAVVGLGIVYYERYWAADKERRDILIHKRDGTPHAATLELGTWRLDTISKAGEAKQDVYRGKPCAAWLAIVGSLPRIYEPYGKREETKNVFWRTLVTNTDRNGSDVGPPDQNVENAFAHWISRICRGTPHPERENIQRGLDLLREWGTPLPHGKIDTGEVNRFASIFRHTNCLRLFRTEGGLLGLGTTSLREGDQVCIVPGSRVPLIFRPATIKPVESGSSSHICESLQDKLSHVPPGYDRAWHLVGACYLHGVMRGEAARRFKAENQQLEKFLVI
ncbi:hypothetical protein CBER1_02502 [Cercospora berteroae]|uniref:Heterokaryon incompatibility domain-containing protein n=1 Tax=Cercospora berteroae TaxID=357750 RepID=A0A2S6C481_9PEZI|nr:hypothetical protein CBER1_02502 [Cercospora berteroae]